MADETRSLHRKLAQVMYEAERIPKNGTAPAIMGGYKFVQVGDAADFIRKALAEKIITMMPTSVTVVGQQDRPTKSGGIMTTVDLITEWTLTDGESGESITIASFGAGADGGDKYSGKASTSAMKYALLTGFLLSTGEDSEQSDTSGIVANRPAPPHLEPAPPRDGSLIGNVEVAKPPHDYELRQGPTGSSLGFGLKEGRHIVRVIAVGPLADALALVREDVVGKRATCYGVMSDETWTINGREIPYTRLLLSRIETPTLVLPADAPSTPLFDEAELDALPVLS